MCKEIVKKKTGHSTLLYAESCWPCQKQSPEVFYKKSCSQKLIHLFWKIFARSVILANDRSFLLENCGHIDLNIDWSCQALYWFDFIGRTMSCRMATTAKIPIAFTILKEIKFNFQRKIKEMQAWHEIPDQTPLPYISCGNCTYAKKGPSNVPLIGWKRKKK